MIVSVNLTIPKYLPILFFVYLVATFIALFSVFSKVSKRLKSTIIGFFIPLIVLSIILIIKPNMIASITAISLTSISLLSIGIWKSLYTDEDILTGVRKIFIVCGLLLPIISFLFYAIIFFLQKPKIVPENVSFFSNLTDSPIYPFLTDRNLTDSAEFTDVDLKPIIKKK